VLPPSKAKRNAIGNLTAWMLRCRCTSQYGVLTCLDDRR
jgi:hypothetical protein